MLMIIACALSLAGCTISGSEPADAPDMKSKPVKVDEDVLREQLEERNLKAWSAIYNVVTPKDRAQNRYVSAKASAQTILLQQAVKELGVVDLALTREDLYLCSDDPQVPATRVFFADQGQRLVVGSTASGAVLLTEYDFQHGEVLSEQIYCSEA